MVTGETQEIKKKETLVRFSIISYKTRLRVLLGGTFWKKDSLVTLTLINEQAWKKSATLLAYY
mgnify:CR=1 FL=1